MRSLLWLSRKGETDSIDRAVEAFEARFETNWPSLGQFWQDYESKKSSSVLAALVKVDLRRRIERGEHPRVLDYLSAFPVLAEEGDRVVSLVYEEFCLLEERGENPDSQVFCELYHHWRDSLASQLAYHRELSRAVGVEYPPVKFPDPGDRFDKYHLTSILGVGGVARVYLATEDELGGRQLAIKVSASFGQEPSILAKLDHRNIVPIWTVAESDSGLRGICMPYRPGLTLEDLIKRIGRGRPPRTSRTIGDVLRLRDSPNGSVPEEQRDGWADFPIDRTFSEAVAWIGLALALALAYLHKQGIYHRDIKPANILLAYREGPQLLDFNLAQDPNDPESATAAQKGGTLPYMAPEQLKAFLDPAAWGDVKEGADLYSLGLVLRELLTGRPPELPSGQGSLAREIQSLLDRRSVPLEPIREINPWVPPALDSIVEKCLAFRPGDRYADANELSDDLRRFLERKPLQNAPNPSKVELGVNWMHRNRHGVVAALMSSLVLIALSEFFQGDSPERFKFDRAEVLLDSRKIDDVLEAKELFRALHHDHPTTAQAALGLALSLRKLNELDPRNYYTDPRSINDLIREVTGMTDAEEALNHRLAKEPGSVSLLITLGIVLSEKQKFALARDRLDQALRIQPDEITAIAALASLEQKAGNGERAIAHLTKAIELELDRNPSGSKVYGYRQILVRQIIQLIDEKLDGPINPETRAQVDSKYQRLVENLNRFREDDWRKMGPGANAELHSYWVRFYEGCLLSIEAVLKIDGPSPAEAVPLFQEAEKRFDGAKFLVEQLTARRDRLIQIKKQVDQLEKRRALLAARR